MNLRDFTNLKLPVVDSDGSIARHQLKVSSAQSRLVLETYLFLHFFKKLKCSSSEMSEITAV
jgi:hypothetical protein